MLEILILFILSLFLTIFAEWAHKAIWKMLAGLGWMLLVINLLSVSFMLSIFVLAIAGLEFYSFYYSMTR